MSDIDLRDQFEAATRPAFAAPIDAEADLARGRRVRRRRRVRQAAAGTSACAVAGAAVMAGLPLVGGGDGSPTGDRTATISTAPDESEEYRLKLLEYEPVIREHLGFELGDGQARIGEGERLGFDGRIPLHDDDPSAATLLVRDAVRVDDAPVPLRCADDPAYDTCERRTLPDGTEIVVGRGEDDLLVATWGRGGDLVEVAAHWAAGAEHNVTLDQLAGLATDDRIWIGSSTAYTVESTR